MNGLIIKDPWIDLILDGKKTWEIRGSNTNMRGTIALIKSGTGQIYGTALLTNSFRITDDALRQGHRNHRIPDVADITYLAPHAWVLDDPVRWDKPLPYKHPQGAVIWVKDIYQRIKEADYE